MQARGCPPDHRSPRTARPQGDAFLPFTPQWEPVQYFNNKIICDLVEEKFKGIISILVSPLLLQGLVL